jgi:CheY-like chemotaxis protein
MPPIANPSPLLLIVDDSRTSRALIRAMIAQARPAWRLIEAASADEALLMIKSEQPDFVSMDLNMPGMGGLEAAGKIRLHHPDIRIVLCTANIQESVRTAAAAAGLCFVAKPVTSQMIAQTIAYLEN